MRRESAFGCLYGNTNTGKTAACIGAYPNAFFIGARGAVSHVAQTVYGIQVASDIGMTNVQGGSLEAMDLETCLILVQWAISKGFEAIVIDDVTLKAERTYRNAAAARPRDGYAGYTEMQRKVFELIDLCRPAQVSILFTAHADIAWIDKDSGIRIKGCPSFPGNFMGVHFPPALDYLYRCMLPGMSTQAPAPAFGAGAAGPFPGMGEMQNLAGAVPGTVPPPAPFIPPVTPSVAGDSWLEWPGVFCTDRQDPDWQHKCRLGLSDRAPMSLGEILRYEGYSPSRPKGLEFMDDAVAKAAGYILAKAGTESEVFGWVNAQVDGVLSGADKSTRNKICRWIRQDTKGRMWITRDLEKKSAMVAPGTWTPKLIQGGAR
jgi:hypothetical protein